MFDILNFIGMNFDGFAKINTSHKIFGSIIIFEHLRLRIELVYLVSIFILNLGLELNYHLQHF